MDQYLLIPFLGGWTSINPSYFEVHQVYKVLTHPHIDNYRIVLLNNHGSFDRNSMKFGQIWYIPRWCEAPQMFGSSDGLWRVCDQNVFGSSQLVDQRHFDWCRREHFHPKGGWLHVFKLAVFDSSLHQLPFLLNWFQDWDTLLETGTCLWCIRQNIWFLAFCRLHNPRAVVRLPFFAIRIPAAVISSIPTLVHCIRSIAGGSRWKCIRLTC